METIGHRMKKMRVDRGLSIKKVALDSGVPPSTYREWEEGRQIKGEPYERIARTFQISLFELLTGRTPEQNQAIEQLESIENACRILRAHFHSGFTK